jgi:RNA recognition motif-containing protein
MEKAEGDPRKLFVGNLSYRTSWKGLKDHFRQAGEVAFTEVFYDYHGYSKGCGIVEFENNDDADNAVKTMDKSELDGRKIFLKEDEDRSKRDYGK